MSCGADKTANQLLTSLLQGKKFTVPEVDLNDKDFQIPKSAGLLYQEPTKLTNEDLTTRVVNGTGTFDAIMSGLAAHLQREFEQSRITGQQYTEAFVAAANGAMQTATSFLLGRDQAFWQSVLAQMQARAAEVAVITARVTLETAKAQLAMARMQALNAEAEYGLTKLKIATEDQQYCLLKAQTAAAQFQVDKLLPAQLTGIKWDNNTKGYTYRQILPHQKDLLKEQVEVQRAQTRDTHDNGTEVKGLVGKQKDLYSQQIVSYIRDAEVKATKLFLDAWITQKTVDEGTDAPGVFNVDSFNVMLRNVKKNNELDKDPGNQDGEMPTSGP